MWRGEPEAPCVVFLPGTMTHPLFYEESLDGLSRAGITVVGVHLRGHGKSPRTWQTLSFEDLVQDAHNAVSHAIERFGGKALVLGSSQGGAVAMAMAAKDGRFSLRLRER